jgi:hypothetical protein
MKAAFRGVRIHAVLTGPTGTDMTRGFDIPKASAEPVARAIFDAVKKGEEDILPDPMSQTMADSWRSGAAKALERQNAALAQARRRCRQSAGSGWRFGLCSARPAAAASRAGPVPERTAAAIGIPHTSGVDPPPSPITQARRM